MRYGIEDEFFDSAARTPCSQSCWDCYYGRPCENVYAQQAREQAQPRFRFYVRTVGDLLTALADTCESSNDTVVARTPQGTYTFEIALVHNAGGAGVVLSLREKPPPKDAQ